MLSNKMIKIFKNFLAKQGITVQFSLGIKSNSIRKYSFNDVDDYIKHYKEDSAKYLIDYAFLWGDSLEEYDFWKRHHDSWQEHLKEFENV